MNSNLLNIIYENLGFRLETITKHQCEGKDADTPRRRLQGVERHPHASSPPAQT